MIDDYESCVALQPCKTEEKKKNKNEVKNDCGKENGQNGTTFTGFIRNTEGAKLRWIVNMDQKTAGGRG